MKFKVGDVVIAPYRGYSSDTGVVVSVDRRLRGLGGRKLARQRAAYCVVVRYLDDTTDIYLPDGRGYIQFVGFWGQFPSIFKPDDVRLEMLEHTANQFKVAKALTMLRRR